MLWNAGFWVHKNQYSVDELRGVLTFTCRTECNPRKFTHEVPLAWLDDGFPDDLDARLLRKMKLIHWAKPTKNPDYYYSKQFDLPPHRSSPRWSMRRR
jgi:hypothetical protein